MDDLKAVVRAHLPIAACVVLCTLAMLGVYRALGALTPAVIWGAVLGTGGALVNLFALQYTLRRGCRVSDPATAAQLVHRSRLFRLLVVCAVCYIGFLLPCFSKLAVALPLFFPRLSTLLVEKVTPVLQLARQKFFSAQ